MSHVAHQYSRVDFYSSLEVNLSLYYGGVVIIYCNRVALKTTPPNVYGQITLNNSKERTEKSLRERNIHYYVTWATKLTLMMRRGCELTVHNLQKWKRVFLTCHCHKIYRDEAVGLKSYKYTWKITIFVKMWNLGQYLENWSSNLKILLHMCDTYNCDYLKHSTFRFKWIDFQLNTVFPFQFCVFFFRKIT